MNLLLMRRLMMTPSDTYSTITGNAPLTLSNAKSKKIKSLIQYGKCSQASTPTPSSPVDINCNNGTLMWKDSELPVGYTRIERITFGGSTHYETNQKLYGSDVVTMTIANFVSGGQNLFGCYSGTSDDVYNFSMYIYGTTTGQAYWRYGKTLYRPTVGSTAQRTISFGAGGTDGFKNDVSYSTVDFESTSTAYIGALPNSSSPKFDGDIVGNVTVGNRLKYIPCIRQSDGAIGYYELMNQTFLEPQGSAPTAGVTDLTHMALEVVGTPEVITVAGGVAYTTVDGQGTYVTPNTTTNRIYKYLGTQEGTFVISVPTDYDFIVQYRSPADNSQAVSSYGNFDSWVNGSVTITLDKGDGYGYGISLRWHDAPNDSISPSDFSGIIKMIKVGTEQTASVASLFAVEAYKDTQDIITGEVVRNIGIKVFDGTESYTSMTYGYSTDELSNFANESFAPLCTHFVGKATSTATLDTLRLYFTSGGIPWTYFYVDQTVDDFSTEDKFKAWVATQYAAGTPVVVVYPLATETTEQVSPQSLSTNSGTNTITITANVSPVSLEVEYAKR